MGVNIFDGAKQTLLRLSITGTFEMNRTIENLVVYNVIGCGVFVVGTAIGLLWFRAMGDPLEKDTILFIVKMFFAIWILGNLLYFVIT